MPLFSFQQQDGSAKLSSTTPTESTPQTTTEAAPVKRGRGRPKKNPQPVIETQIIPVSGTVENTELVSQQQQQQYVPLCTSNDPYEMSYGEGINLVRTTIAQMDILAGEMKTEFDNIKSSKALKGRYTYMGNIGEAISSVLSSKLAAIKELNGITTKCHELEMKRYQQNKELQKAEDDDRYIANLYNAYINTPVNAGGAPQFMQSTAQNTIGNPNAMMSGVQVMPNGDITNGYDNFMSKMTPEQNRMILEHNPNVETVVVYDRATGGCSFDVIDSSTGYSIPNYPRPNRELLDEASIDLQNGIASNSNIGQSWKIVVQGDALANF